MVVCIHHCIMEKKTKKFVDFIIVVAIRMMLKIMQKARDQAYRKFTIIIFR